MDGVSPTCATCLRAIAVDTQDFMCGQDLPFVDEQNVCVHVFCHALRASTPAARARAASEHSKRHDEIQQVRPSDVLADTLAAIGTGTGTGTDECALCRERVDGSEPFARFVGCAHALMHVACTAIAADMARRVSCPLCPAPDDIRDKERQWLGETVREQPRRVHVILPPPAPEQQGPVSVLDAVMQRTPAHILTSRFTAMKHTLGQSRAEPAYDTPARQLVDEMCSAAPQLRHGGFPTALLPLLREMDYTSSDALDLGVSLPMLLADSANLDVLLDRHYFMACDLPRAPLGVTFTRLILAGVDVARVVAAKYTVSELANIRFSAPALKAAGGTRAELDALGVSENDLFLKFGYTDDIASGWA